MNKQRVFSLSIILCLFCFFSLNVTAQKKPKKSQNVRVADSYYGNEEYFLASDYYKKELEENPSDPYANFRLAECYRLYFDYDNAEDQYRLAVKHGNNEQPLAQFWLAMMIKSNGKYERAKLEFDKFISNFRPISAEDRRIEENAKLERDGCILALKELRKPIRNYEFENLPAPVNTQSSEYAPNFYESDSSIVLASAREDSKGNEKDTRLGESYSDNYRFFLKGKRWSQYDDKDKFSNVNTIRNDGAGAFKKDLTEFYYTSCIEEDYPCAIYVSIQKDGVWQEGERLNDNINFRGYETKQPTLLASGDTMIFVSDRPDGKGQNDLWFSVKSSGENWEPARNMGNINTPYVDMSPFYYSKDKTLFFSSNGRDGFGGLDIFRAQGPTLSEITNMGLPFNTNRDEFYLSLGQVKGLLSSNRQGGKGNDDIYYFNIKSKELLLAKINKDSLAGNLFSIITKLTYKPGGEPASDIPVTLLDEDGNIILKTTSNELGDLSFDNLKSGETYKVMLEEDMENIYADVKYKGKNGEFDLNGTRDGKMLALITKEILDKFSNLTVLSTIVYSNSGDPASDVPVLLMDEDGLVLKQGKTNIDGLARFESLSSDKNYRIVIDESDPALTKSIAYEVKDIKLKWLSQASEKAHFENIYFDFNAVSIRPEAQKTLENLAGYLKSNKEVQLEMNANTDNIGTPEFNKELAAERGNAVVAFLEGKGVDKSAIIVNALGADVPIASNETPIGRQLNRRVEFYVVGGPGYETDVMTYVVEPKIELNQVAQKFNMTPEELKQLNNIQGNSLEAFVPLRVRKTGDNGLVAPITMTASSDNKYNEFDGPSMRKQSAIQADRMPSLSSGQSYHVVEPLQTLYAVASKYGMTVKEIKAVNGITSDIIQIGQKLIVQEKQVQIPEGPNTYTVKEGDTLYSIAVNHGTTVAKLMAINNLDSPMLFATMVLKIK